MYTRICTYIQSQYLLNEEEEACDIPTLDSYEVASHGKTFTWRVLLHWANAHDEPSAFPGTQNFITQQGKLQLQSEL